jgi:hypothetical protein
MYILILLFIILLASVSVIETHISYAIPFNMPTRSTRGMTYDIRCLPKIKKDHMIWLNSHLSPNHYGKCLEMK